MHLCRNTFASLLLFAALRLPAQQLAITVDDLPAHADLPAGETRQDVADQMVATFQRERLPKVYGFINAQSVDDEPETVGVLQAWHDHGEPLGNHTWAHVDLSKVTAEEFLADVDRNEAMLKRFDTRGDSRWFRYPYLHEGDTLEKHRAVRKGLKKRGYKVAEVSMDFEDYLWNDPYARCMDKRDEAGLQYLHDSYLQTAAQYADLDRRLAQRLFHRDIRYVLLLHIGAFDAKMLPELIALYRSKGFSFVSLPDAMNDRAYRKDPAGGDADGGSYTELLMTIKGMDPGEKEKPYAELEALCR